MAKKALTCLFLAFTLFCLAQEEGTFNKELSQKDSILFQNLRQKIVIHINPNPDSALFYIKEMRKFSEEKNFPSGLADSEYTMGLYYRRIQKMDSAIHYFSKSQKTAKKNSYSRGEARALNALCRGYYFIGETEKAQKAGFDCIAVLKKLGDLAILLDTYTALGNSYMRQNNFTTAVSFFLKADSIHTKSPQRPDIIAAAYQSLGNVYKELKDYTKAIEFYGKANAEFKKLPANAEYFSNNTNMQLGSIYYLTADYIKADSLLNKAHAYFKKIGDENALAQTSTYLGLVKMKLNELDAAELFLTEGYQMNQNNQLSYETNEARLKLAELFVNRQNYSRAIENAQGVLSSNRESNKSLDLEANKILSEAYSAIGNYAAANNALITAFQLRDSIYHNQNQASIRDLETKYQTEKKEQEITLLKSQKELAEQKQKSQRDLLLGGIGLTSLAGLFLFVLYRNRQKTNKKLRELDTAKSNFFANISHELRTPLTLIKGPLEAQLEDADLSAVDKQNLSIAKNNTERLETLVDQLLDLSKLESGFYSLRVSQRKLSHFLKLLTESFTYKAKQKKQQLISSISIHNNDYWFDADVLQKVVSNLLGNALKYSPANQKIELLANVEDNHLVLVVRNTGTHLSKDELAQIFNRFHRGNENEPGTGIGLALTKELVELHKGSIQAKSEVDSVTFLVKLPVGVAAFEASEKLVTPQEEVHIKPLRSENISFEFDEPKDTSPKGEQPIILVVDDNTDVRTYVSSLFKGSFQITTAENGKTGFQNALEQVPDLIITDLMMPEDDGLKLTENCKTHDATSHIPIVMLTAKAGDENQLEGLETGADAYLTKPFNNKILKQTVNNLLESRKKLQERFSREVILSPKEISIDSYDERFLSALQDVLDNQLVESDFSVEEFSKAVGMSRMQLHRKLKALTGLSATEFVRSQRLKLAAQLLKKSEISVSQVGYSVGFNDHSYFTKCFKKLYKCTPSEYAKKS